MKTVSVIIPIYKAEKYLPKCIKSVLIQEYPSIEIILIDDGSPDRCPILCDQYANQYSNIKVIHQKNKGLGFSRNLGVENALGDYIMFLDSDDCLDGKRAVSHLMECAKEKKADIVVGNFRRFDETMVSNINRHHLYEGNYTKTVDFRFQGFYRYGHLAYNWGKLYKKSFLKKNQLKSPNYPFTQDKAYNMTCLSYEPVYAFISESVYLYRVNEESVTFRYKENFISVWISIATDFYSFLKKREIKKQYGDLMAFHIFFGSFFLVKQELQFKKHGILESVKMLKIYGKNPFVKKAINSLAKGKYLKEIHALSWKIMIRAASLCFSFHCYWFFAVGIWMLRKLKIDEKITKARYKTR